MQLIWLTFEMIDDLDFQEWIQAQAKLPKRRKNDFFTGASTCEYLQIPANTCEYLKIWYLVFVIRANTKWCEYQIAGLVMIMCAWAWWYTRVFHFRSLRVETVACSYCRLRLVCGALQSNVIEIVGLVCLKWDKFFLIDFRNDLHQKPSNFIRSRFRR